MSAQILLFPVPTSPRSEFDALMSIGRKLLNQPNNDVMLDYWLDRMDAWQSAG